MTDAHVAQALAEVEMSPAETPARLRERASVLMGDYRAAVASLPRLQAEIALLRGLAVAAEHAGAARGPVAEAEAAVAAAQAAYETTAGPEAEAASHAVRARQAFEAARDSLAAAQEVGVDVAAETGLVRVATEAALVDERRLQVLARAQEARVLAKRDLDSARSQLARARQTLAEAEAALASPQAADVPVTERWEAMRLMLAERVLAHASGLEPMDARDWAIASVLIEGLADIADVCPPRVRRKIAAQAADEATKALRATRVTVPGSSLDTTVGALAGAVPGR